MTKSEKITGMISERYFLPQYIYADVYAKENKQEKEFCDCLIEFSSVYIVIQIKERNDSAAGSNEQWFEKKVVKKAKSQLKDTFSYYKNSANHIFSKSSDLVLDRNKELLPVIVFLNNDLTEYKRTIYSKSLNLVINIFSISDFEVMLQTLKLPYDIISYLVYRLAFESTENKKLILDKVNEDFAILLSPRTEHDYSYMFLARNYYKHILRHELNEENIAYYNELISQLNISAGCQRSKFIEGLLCVDYYRADKISKNWIKLLDLAKKDEFVFPYTITIEDRVYMFMIRPNRMSEAEFKQYLEYLLIYRKYIDKANIAHLILISYAQQERWSIEIGDVDLNNLIRYDELVDKVVEAIESKK
ncbi:hypothetical protein ABE547_14235 [Dorea sp. YH-dor226]|uniref:hypothetical protein n=1 Tax=Lachnospiraceae TaxID=186803 RepID=UPI001F2FF5CE|nr:hypothetical protein [Faecalicatena contorta]MCF2679920.1 hypothetical protein [Faecalicatena contorta]